MYINKIKIVYKKKEVPDSVFFILVFQHLYFLYDFYIYTIEVYSHSM